MSRTPFILIMLLFCFTGCRAQTSGNMIDTRTIDSFELDSYLGTWYELARFDHSFERGLQGVTATYSMRKDGKIKVENQGYRGSLDGKQSRAVGKAKFNPNGKPGQLKVAFFLFFYGDYFILELDPGYQWAIIGSSSDNFMWILSRTPQVEPELREKFLTLIKQRGYDTGKLIWVDQPLTNNH